MCVIKVQHITGRKTGFFRFFDFLTNIATGNRKKSEFVQPQPVVRSFAVGFSPISVFFPVQQTGPANTSRRVQWTVQAMGYQGLWVPGGRPKKGSKNHQKTRKIPKLCSHYILCQL